MNVVAGRQATEGRRAGPVPGVAMLVVEYLCKGDPEPQRIVF